jgi:hypothetical protein
MSTMKPTLGRIVLYKFTAEDAAEGLGRSGDHCVAVVCRVHTDTCVNLRLLSDNDRTPRKCSVSNGNGQGQWFWPPREDGVATSPGAKAVPAPAPAAAPQPAPAPSPGVVAATTTVAPQT